MIIGPLLIRRFRRSGGVIWISSFYGVVLEMNILCFHSHKLLFFINPIYLFLHRIQCWIFLLCSGNGLFYGPTIEYYNVSIAQRCYFLEVDGLCLFPLGSIVLGTTSIPFLFVLIEFMIGWIFFLFSWFSLICFFFWKK